MATAAPTTDNLDIEGTLDGLGVGQSGGTPTPANARTVVQAAGALQGPNPNAVDHVEVHDAKGVKLPFGTPVPPGGYQVITYADGHKVKESVADVPSGGFLGVGETHTAGHATSEPLTDVDAGLQQAFNTAMDRHNKAVEAINQGAQRVQAQQTAAAAATTRAAASTQRANIATTQTAPAQAREADARALETGERTKALASENAARASNPQGLSPSEVIAQQQLVQKQAEFAFQQKIDEIKTRVAEGTLDLDKAKKLALDEQNKAANKLAEDTHAIERQRIASEETRNNQNAAVSQRGQDLGFAGSLASTMGRALETERATQMTPAETRNLAKARNYMMNPAGPVPTYEAPTGQLPSMKDQITDMVNQILRQVSPTAAAALGQGPSSSGGIVMPSPVGPMAPSTSGGPPPMGASSAGMAALPTGPSPVTGPANAQFGAGGVPTGPSDDEQRQAAATAARMGNFNPGPGGGFVAPAPGAGIGAPPMYPQPGYPSFA